MATHLESPKISNLSYAGGKQLARHIFLETMATIDVRHAMLAKLKREGGALVAGGVSIPLLRPPRVVAFGKAANRMAATLDEILSGQIERGVVVSPAEPARRLERFRYFMGGHPRPNAGSFEGADAALELVSKLKPDDFVIFLVSGGGSALMERPLDPAITLADMIEFNRILVGCGLPIEQINVLRKHLSAIKGGRLGVRAHPARQMTIFISDVPDHLPSMVASGPTMADESTTAECFSIAEQHGLTKKFPASIRDLFEKRAIAETPKPGDERFANSRYFCLLSNRDALEAAKAAAEKLGFLAEIDASNWDADFRQVTDANLAALRVLRAGHQERPVCLIAGGEVICPVTGPGMGGRNQAFTLYAAEKIVNQKIVVLSAGTDGRDGNSPTSGAVADGQTLSRAHALSLDAAHYLAESDSYYFFRSLGDTLDTGFTDNNVRDVRIWLGFG
ncbi:MAG: glycerate kinase [Terriglobia bacterium]